MARSIRIRAFEPADAAAVNRVALAAFAQFRADYADWPRFSAGIGRMSDLAATADLIVADHDGAIAGAVGYVAAGLPRQSFFQTDWPIVRMLVVHPDRRGLGIGRALTQACIDRAIADGAPVLALHTSPIMRVARSLYLRMGFDYRGETPPISGVPYGLYVRTLPAGAAATT